MTQQYTAIVLRDFKGPLHLSFGKEDNYDQTQTLLHSDTLKSAIAVCALQLGLCKGGEDVKTFMESFSISSAYPMAKVKDSNHYFFPKPIIAQRLTVEGDDKKAKKVKYVDKDLFEKLLTCKQSITTDNVKGDFAFAVEPDKNEDFEVFDTDGYQHVAIPRDGISDSNPYIVDKLYFNEGCGLFFLTDAQGNTLKSLKACIKLLADNGIGTDRTTGHGQFEFDEQTDVNTISFKLPDNATHQMSLSLYCPQKTEIEELDTSYYDLIKRGGYIASPENDNHLSIRKKSVYMFVEGSLFPNSGSRKGKIVDLMPNKVALQESGQSEIGHPVWRDGTSIFLPFTHSQNKA
ncbi:MAG: type III-A CRISPR-associated RAMP protein Csm4 [Chitinophagales bacterium]|nr:type III-A CRISPR-associated RAMP protein Csm4 [Chitinophagales bacterium]